MPIDKGLQHLQPHISQRSLEKLPEQAMLKLTMNCFGPEHMLAPAHAEHRQRLFTLQPTRTIDPPSPIEGSRNEHAVNPSFQDGRDTEPEDWKWEHQQICRQHLLDLDAYVRRKSPGLKIVPLSKYIRKEERRDGKEEIR